MKKYQKTLITAASVASFALLVVPALAATGNPTQGMGPGGWGGFGGQGGKAGLHAGQAGVMGSVTAINGSSLTVQTNRPNATTTYTVDASNATVFKANATSSLASIAVGDNVFAQGTVSGTSVTATIIRDGMMGRGGPGMMGRGNGKSATSSKRMVGAPISFQGNGQPVVEGNITSVNGTSLAITNKSNVSYTIDASSANIQKQGIGTTTVSSLAVGDSILVQGAVNGSAVTALAVIDQGVPPSNHTSGTSTAPQNRPNFVSGIIGSIGNFFSHLFGF